MSKYRKIRSLKNDRKNINTITHYLVKMNKKDPSDYIGLKSLNRKQIIEFSVWLYQKIKESNKEDISLTQEIVADKILEIFYFRRLPKEKNN
jgi:low affinity Fe/Cu permease